MLQNYLCLLFFILSKIFQKVKVGKNVQVGAFKLWLKKNSPQLDSIIERSEQIAARIDEVVGIWNVSGRLVAGVRFAGTEDLHAVSVAFAWTYMEEFLEYFQKKNAFEKI